MAIEKELRAKITADTSDFDKKTKGTEGKSRSFASKMVGFAKLIAAAWIFKKAFDSLRQLIGGMTQMADRLRDLSDMTDISTDTLQEYQYVAKIAGVNTEALSNASHGLTQRLARGLTEMSPLNVALKHLGLNAHDASGKLRSGADIMDDVIKRLADMEDVTQRNVLGAQIFAGAWKDMAPILGMGAEGIEKLRKEAHDLGIVMSEDALNSANDLRMAQVRLQESSAALGREIGSALIPTLTKLAEVALDATKALRRTWDFVDPGGMAERRLSEFRESLKDLDEETRRSKIIEFTRQLQKEQQYLGEQLDQQPKKLNWLQRNFSFLTKEQKENEVQTRVLEERYDAFSIIIRELTENYDEWVKVIKESKGPVEDVGEAIQEVIAPALEFKEIIERTDQEIFDLIGDLELVTEQYERMEAPLLRIIDHMRLLAEAARHFGDQIVHAMVVGEEGLKGYSKAVARSARENIKAYMAEAIAATIKAHIGLGPFGVIFAGIAAGAAAAIFNQLVPSFAKGGAVSGPTLALIGEGPGVSRSNPEYVGTANQMAKMGQGGNLKAEFQRDKMIIWLEQGRDSFINKY